MLEAKLAGRPVDVVLSDMAPNLSGVAASDAARMADLVELAIEFSTSHLKPDGVLAQHRRRRLPRRRGPISA